MTIPDFQTVMRPILVHLADGEARRSRGVKDLVADEFGLTDEERAEMLPSGRQRIIDNRVSWALTHMAQAGLLERPSRGVVRITDAGRQALERNPDRVDLRVLRQFPAYVEFRNRTSAEAESVRTTPEVARAAETASPQDLAGQAMRANHAAVEGELLQRAMALPPVGFEDLVMRLLGAMGYGHSGAVERTSETGDAGIDGIISQDPLGLDRIYVQAKRYAEDRVIHRPTIQGFVGALMSAQGDRGVFITTSSFSRGAIDEAERVNARIELIDGARLAKLMLRHTVGVQPETVVTLYEIDEDFFEGL